jgi:hypothetical protein
VATPTISVNKETVRQLLEGSSKQPFLIPEYQRPYAWSDDEITTLFDDLREFAENEVTKNNDSTEGTYFLGTVVSYINEDKEQEIIDGQQRITSILLLLRAIYTKLKSASVKTDEAKNFIKQIEPTIWRQNKLTGAVDYSKILISSRVMDDEGNEVFRTILETGIAKDSAQDNYSRNYILFQKLYDDLCQSNPLIVYNFVYCLLNCAIVLPIQADTQDTALTIFSTLNDRGMPLSDADIFKAKMYDSFNPADKKIFIERWKELEARASYAEESIQHLFYYYMFYLRAREGNIDTTTPGVRKYFSQNKFEKLKKLDVLDDLDRILNLWVVVNKHEQIDGEPWTSDFDILKILDMLSSYPNEFWKYPVVIFYLTYFGQENFEADYLVFLRKLFSELVQRYILTPTINAVKPAIIKLDVGVIKSVHPTFEFKPIDDYRQLENNIKVPLNKNTIRLLLKALAYLADDQTVLLPDKWEIEHILPQHWHTNYFINGYTDEKIRELINEIGNLAPFEKKLNIVAGDGYYDKKKEQYQASKIAITREMADLPEWNPESIIERNIRISDQLLAQFKAWDEAYSEKTI